MPGVLQGVFLRDFQNPWNNQNHKDIGGCRGETLHAGAVPWWVVSSSKA